jgi:putative transposase
VAALRDSLLENVFSLVPAGKVRTIAKMLKAIHAQEDRRAAAEKMAAVIADLRAMRLARAVELLEESAQETLTFCGFPDSHWIKLRTSNPLERIMWEIRRRTRVVGAFPDGTSGLNLAAARLRHIAGTQSSTRTYMNMTPLFADRTQGAAVA